MDFIFTAVTLSEPVFWSLVGGIPASIGGGWAVQRKKPAHNGNGNGQTKSDVKVLQAEMKGLCKRMDKMEANQTALIEDISFIRGRLEGR